MKQALLTTPPKQANPQRSSQQRFIVDRRLYSGIAGAKKRDSNFYEPKSFRLAHVPRVERHVAIISLDPPSA